MVSKYKSLVVGSVVVTLQSNNKLVVDLGKYIWNGCCREYSLSA